MAGQLLRASLRLVRGTTIAQTIARIQALKPFSGGLEARHDRRAAGPSSSGRPGSGPFHFSSSGHETALRRLTSGSRPTVGRLEQGPSWRTQAGQAVYCAMGLEPGFSMAAPATGPVVLRARIRRCRCPSALPQLSPRGGTEDEIDRPRYPPRLLRGRDRRGGRDPLSRADRDEPGGAGALCR